MQEDTSPGNILEDLAVEVQALARAISAAFEMHPFEPNDPAAIAHILEQRASYHLDRYSRLLKNQSPGMAAARACLAEREGEL